MGEGDAGRALLEGKDGRGGDASRLKGTAGVRLSPSLAWPFCLLGRAASRPRPALRAGAACWRARQPGPGASEQAGEWAGVRVLRAEEEGNMLRIYPVILEVLRQLRPVVKRIELKDRDLAGQLRRCSTSSLSRRARKGSCATEASPPSRQLVLRPRPSVLQAPRRPPPTDRERSPQGELFEEH
jgi:hypothetical protein